MINPRSADPLASLQTVYVTVAIVLFTSLGGNMLSYLSLPLLPYHLSLEYKSEILQRRWGICRVLENQHRDGENLTFYNHVKTILNKVQFFQYRQNI